MMLKIGVWTTTPVFSPRGPRGQGAHCLVSL